MDLRSFNVIYNDRGPICPQISNFSYKNSCFERQFYCGRSVLEIGVSKSKLCLTYRSLVVRCIGRKNRGNSSSGNNEPNPEEGGSKGSTPPSKSNMFDITDWRKFRANLVHQEKVQLLDVDTNFHDRVSHEISKPLGLKWAHSISVPETGCVLVATEKLDGVPSFERTVVLLLKSGNTHPHEGPFGVFINRPLHKKIKHLKSTNPDLATTFADCSLYSGGPLEANMFLLNAGEKPQGPDFEQVIPGLCFGARNNLDEAAALVKKGVLRPRDFRFFVGYAGWQLDQLREEIESNYWYVAACSANLINGGGSSSGLWEEILQLMGGHYSEISKKPKQDS
ncbi:hypothetical protein AQUCO_01400086v1 [Aquilegia coerulea]|uniref:Uncharacterized protein n=2 Tax=Aquilegia coerulea TaxID=218851 RepID=A0A2G5DUF9_AQUCA|nr:hypothetical protein AQUCO_01400086v1 [Aquilegia coerulea]